MAVDFIKIRSFIIAPSFLLLFICISGFSMAFSAANTTHFDFRMLYTAGYMVREGYAERIYDYEETKQFQNERVSQSEKALPFDHLAYEALLYVPFSIFRYQTAYLLFLAFNLCILFWSFRLLKPYLLELAEVWRYLPVVLFVCFLPVTMSLIEGQDSILLLVIIIIVAAKLDAHRDLLAGSLLGLACFKFQYVIPVALLYLIWRRWHFAIGFAFSSLAVTGISIWLTGVDHFISYAHLLGGISSQMSAVNAIKMGVRPELMPNLRGLIYAMAGPSQSGNLITLFASGCVFLWAAIRRTSFPLAILAAVLVSYHESFTDATLLIVPVGLAIAMSLRHSSTSSPYIATLSAVILASPALLLLLGVRFYLLAVPILGLFFFWDFLPSSNSEGVNQKREATR